MLSGDVREFLKAAIRHPMQVSTFFPTRPPLAEALLAEIDFSREGLVIEAGPGTGAITDLIEPKLRDRDLYLGVEINPQMTAFLRQKFPHLRFANGGIQELRSMVGDQSANAVISSLPWTVFSPALQKAALDAIYHVLSPSGRFVTYVCLNARVYPAARRFLRLLRATFPKVRASQIIWANVPPATVFVAERNGFGTDYG